MAFSQGSNSPPSPSFQRLIQVASTIAVLLGCIILVSWKYDIGLLKGNFTTVPLVPKANAGLGLLLSGAALGLLNGHGKWGTAENKSRRTLLVLASSPFAAVISTTVVLLGFLTLSQYLFGWNLGIDELLVRESPKTFATIHPGRMGAPTALNFVLVGGALLMLSQNTQRWILPAQNMTLLAALIALQALVGHAYGVQTLYGIAPSTLKMALYTAVGFLVLCVGVLCLQPNKGLMQKLTTDSMGGWMMRRLLPMAIAIPILLGGIIVCSQRAGHYHPIFAMTLFVVATVVVFVLLIYHNSRLLDLIDYERQRATEALHHAYDQLEKRVDERTVELQQSNQQLQQEIRDRKQIEQIVQEQAMLISVASDAIHVRDLSDCILLWNPGAERLYGWQTAEVLGQKATELLFKTIPPEVTKAHQTVLEQGHWEGELSKITKSGKEVIVANRLTLIRDETGQPKSILAVDTDVTETKRLEAKFLRAQRLESLGNLASGIAHDFNNILTPIIAVAQLLPLRLPHLEQRDREMLKMLEENAKRAADLVKQILLFARGVDAKRTPIQLAQLLPEIIRIVQGTFPKSIDIEVRIPSQDLWIISADTTQLHQVIMNLCVNARDAMPDGGTLAIAADNQWVDDFYAQMMSNAQPGYYVVITVSDTGIGMSKEVLEKIFDPFFTTKKLGEGTGLGLSTVMGIVKNHGGFLTVESEQGLGSQFKIFLPTAEGTISQSVESIKLLQGHGELILVVDDEAAICSCVTTLLEDYNYRTLTANDGASAIALYAKNKQDIQVVLMDLMMPGIDGLTTIRALQKINPNVRVIATSGLVSNSSLTEVIGKEIKIFLPKPYTLKELLEALSSILNQDNLNI